MIDKFNFNEIETILKVIFECRREEECFGNSSDEYKFPHNIETKVLSLNSKEYNDFLELCNNICDELEDYISNDINSLHKFHENLRIILQDLETY